MARITVRKRSRTRKNMSAVRGTARKKKKVVYKRRGKRGRSF